MVLQPIVRRVLRALIVTFMLALFVHTAAGRRKAPRLSHEEHFDLWDMNKDGQITKDEYMIAMKAQNGGQIADPVLDTQTDALFADHPGTADKDQDGVITREEWNALNSGKKEL